MPTGTRSTGALTSTCHRWQHKVGAPASLHSQQFEGRWKVRMGEQSVMLRLAHASFTTRTTSSGAAAPPHSHPRHTLPPAEMSVRMSNLDNERDERDEDSHEDRGISGSRRPIKRPLDLSKAVVFLTAASSSSFHFQSATHVSSPPCWSATHTPRNAGGGTGAAPGRRAITVGRVTGITY